MPVGRGSMTGRVAFEGQVVHIADIASDEEYSITETVTLEKTHTMLGVPLLREGVVVGTINLGRQRVQPFTDRQIELVRTFADQAVIAIENVRLLDELQARTEELGRSVQELKALGDVTQAVNSTLDLETVLATIVAKAVQLSGTDAGAIYVFDEAQQQFRLSATYGMDEALIAAIRDQRIGAGERLMQQRCFGSRTPAGPRPSSGALLAGAGAHPARRLSIAAGCAVAQPRHHRRRPGGTAARHRYVRGWQDRPPADLRGPIGAGDPERQAVP